MTNQINNKPNKVNDHHVMWSIILSISSLLSILFSVLLMYLIYKINYNNDPNSNMLSGYWITFIFMVIPIYGIVYSYTRKARHENYLYLILLIISLLSLIALIILAAVGIYATSN